MVITYTGSFMGKRSSEHFLEAVSTLIDNKTVISSDIIIRFVGHFDKSTYGIFKRYENKVTIETIDFQPYEKSLAYQADSDLLLLIVGIDESEGGEQIFTGKFFEYIGANRPVFAIAPNGPLKKIIERGCFGIVAPPKDIHQIAEKFRTLYFQWKDKGRLSFKPDMNIRESFTRKRLTENLASIIADIC